MKGNQVVDRTAKSNRFLLKISGCPFVEVEENFNAYVVIFILLFRLEKRDILEDS